MFILQNWATIGSSESKSQSAADVLDRIVSFAKKSLGISKNELQAMVRDIIGWGNFSLSALNDTDLQCLKGITKKVTDSKFYTDTKSGFSKEFNGSDVEFGQLMESYSELLAYIILAKLKKSVGGRDIDDKDALKLRLEGDYAEICRTTNCTCLGLLKTMDEADEQAIKKSGRSFLEAFQKASEQGSSRLIEALKYGRGNSDKTKYESKSNFGQGSYANVEQLAKDLAKYSIEVLLPALAPKALPTSAPDKHGSSSFVKSVSDRTRNMENKELVLDPLADLMEKENRKKRA